MYVWYGFWQGGGELGVHVHESSDLGADDYGSHWWEVLQTDLKIGGV